MDPVPSISCILVSRAVTLSQAMSAYWSEACAVSTSSEKDVSTVLLMFPEIELFGNDYR